MLITIGIHVLTLGSLVGLHFFTWRYGCKGGLVGRNLFYSFFAAIVWVLFFAVILPGWMLGTVAEVAENVSLVGLNPLFFLIGFVQAGMVWPLFVLIANQGFQSKKPSNALPWFLGLLSLTAAAALAGMLYVLIALSRMGDGAGPYGPTPYQQILVYSPVLGLLLIAFSCLPFMCGPPLLVVGVIAHLIFCGVAVLLIFGKAWWLVFPTLFFLFAWHLLYRQRKANPISHNLEPKRE